MHLYREQFRGQRHDIGIYEATWMLWLPAIYDKHWRICTEDDASPRVCANDMELYAAD